MDDNPHTLNHLQLPESLRSLIDCVGEEAALQLVEWRGGAYINVPRKVNIHHPLLEHIGAMAFAKLVEWYAGESVMLPKNDSVMRQIKHALIRELRYQNNMPIDQIALRVHYSMRRVFQVLAEDHPPHRNHDLF